MTLILARYYEEYLKYIQKHQLPISNFRYVRDALSLRGLRGISRFWILPESYLRSDYADIMEELRMLTFYNKIIITKF